jgi:hypothetical protein
LEIDATRAALMIFWTLTQRSRSFARLRFVSGEASRVNAGLNDATPLALISLRQLL